MKSIYLLKEKNYIKKIYYILQLTRENPLANSDLKSSFFPFHDPYALLKAEGVFNKSFLWLKLTPRGCKLIK